MGAATRGEEWHTGEWRTEEREGVPGGQRSAMWEASEPARACMRRYDVTDNR